MTGIESEIVHAAEPIQIGAAIVAKVAQVGHLIALKLVSRDDKRRPQDRGDLAALAKVATEAEWLRAEQAIRLIEQQRLRAQARLAGRAGRVESVDERAVVVDAAGAPDDGCRHDDQWRRGVPGL